VSNLAKRFLFVVRRAPVNGLLAKETLDLILSVAAFDQPVRVLFVDDGVFQLVAPQTGGSSGTHTDLSMLKLLEFYDVREVLVEHESLRARGLDNRDLAVSAALIPASTAKDLWAEHDLVVVG
jgi:tRNA 2-thiouridine synthesizing protein C